MTRIGVRRHLLPWGTYAKTLVEWLEEPGTEFFIDSGAYSVSTQKIELGVDEYGDFLLEYVSNERVEAYANLDVIGDAEATHGNQVALEERGLDPVPTYHQGENLKWLHLYLMEHDYVALGGMVGTSRSQLYKFLDECFSVIRDYWPVRIHGFGISASWALQRYPFYSVDSVTYMDPVMFGPKAFRHKVWRKTQDDHREMILKESVARTLELERYITRLWKKRGISFST
jgi:hypothetical protein